MTITKRFRFPPLQLGNESLDYKTLGLQSTLFNNLPSFLKQAKGTSSALLQLRDGLNGRFSRLANIIYKGLYSRYLAIYSLSSLSEQSI